MPWKLTAVCVQLTAYQVGERFPCVYRVCQPHDTRFHCISLTCNKKRGAIQALKQNSSVKGPISKFRINCNLSRPSCLSDIALCSSGPANKAAACTVGCVTAASNPCRCNPSSGNSRCCAERFCTVCPVFLSVCCTLRCLQT